MWRGDGGRVNFGSTDGTAPGLVRPASPRPALARETRRGSRSLPRMALGDHAAADHGQGRDPLLSALRGTLADRPRPRRRGAGRGDGGLGRARLLRPRAASARLRAPCRPCARRPVPRHRRGPPGASGSRSLHLGRDRRDRLRPSRGGGRRQRRAGDGAPPRHRRTPAPRREGHPRDDRGARAGGPARRLRPGPDGPRRDRLHAAPPRLRPLSVARRLRGTKGRNRGGPAAPRAEEGAAAPSRPGLLARTAPTAA